MANQYTNNNYEYLIGTRVGASVIKKILPKQRNNQGKNVTYCEMECDCGNVFSREIGRVNEAIRKGSMTSCGCIAGVSKRNDFTGKRFGMLTVQKMIPATTPSGNKRMKFECRCDCGNTVFRYGTDLKSGKFSNSIPSCGCSAVNRRKNHIGEKYGHLTIINEIYGVVDNNGRKRTVVECVCDCGNRVVRKLDNVLSSGIHSCGCAKKEIIRNAVGRDVTGQKFGKLTVLEVLWNESPVMVRCKCDCGNVIIRKKTEVTSYSTQSCGCSLMSIGETIIKDYLIDHDMRFDTQYTFCDCRYTNVLRFDFAVFNDDGDISFLIEYNGKQHYEPIDYFGGQSLFEYQQLRDKIKRDYCTEKNYKLYEIPYFYSREQILQELSNIISSVTTAVA